MDNVINIFAIVLFLLCWFLIIKKLIWNKVAPVNTVKAEVVDKYKSNMVSKYPGTFSVTGLELTLVSHEKFT